MARLGTVALLTSCFLLASCGGPYFVGFVSNPGGSSSVSGTVSDVSSGFYSDGNASMNPSTLVTFTASNTEVTINFCGDQRQSFPLNKEVRVQFKAGIACSVLMSVVVGDELQNSTN